MKFFDRNTNFLFFWGGGGGGGGENWGVFGGEYLHSFH